MTLEGYIPKLYGQDGDDVLAGGAGDDYLEGSSLTFFIVQYLPPAPDYDNQEAFSAVLGVVWRAVVASLVGYLAGQLLNSYVLVWIRKKWGAKHLWARLIGSTIVGEAADTILFCTILFYGDMTLRSRSEERRVGKECRSRWSPYH